MICTMQVTNYNYYNNYNVYSARVHVKYYACTYYTVSDIIGRVQSCVNSHQPEIGVQLQLLEALVFSCLHRMYSALPADEDRICCTPSMSKSGRVLVVENFWVNLDCFCSWITVFCNFPIFSSCIFAFCSNLLSALLLRRLRLVVDQPLLGVGIEQ